METLLSVLNNLYLSNLQLYGVNRNIEVMLSINEIKTLLGYERLSVQKFHDDFKGLLNNVGVGISVVEYSDFIKFDLNHMLMTSVDAINRYNSIIGELTAEAQLTGAFHKIGVDL